jgi:hypothetical protein
MVAEQVREVEVDGGKEMSIAISEDYNSLAGLTGPAGQLDRRSMRQYVLWLPKLPRSRAEVVALAARAGLRAAPRKEDLVWSLMAAFGAVLTLRYLGRYTAMHTG